MFVKLFIYCKIVEQLFHSFTKLALCFQKSFLGWENKIPLWCYYVIFSVKNTSPKNTLLLRGIYPMKYIKIQESPPKKKNAKEPSNQIS